MCGRYQLNMDDPTKYKKRFNLKATTDIKSNYNIAPSQTMPVIQTDNEQKLMKWGLIPFWDKGKENARGLINIRDDSATEKKWAHKYIQFQRCIVPASGFYEWKKTSDNKIPYFIHLKDNDYFGFAGVYDGNTYSIITTTPNEIMADIHTRMPVILEKNEEEKWLNPDITEVETIKTFLKPYPSHLMEAYPISTKMNSPSYNVKDITDRITARRIQS